MGREFLHVFEEWAERYDSSVSGHDEQYREVFRGYEEILSMVAHKASGVTVEFGVGTGNLTEKLIQNGCTVLGIEPSEPMRALARKKLGTAIELVDGDFLTFPLPDSPIETFVSTYAFHHLNDEEKARAIRQYGTLLKKDGKIIFADTSFTSKDAHLEMIETAKKQGYHDLASDLGTEHYTTIPILTDILKENGFAVQFTQLNAFVWLMEAVKL